MQGIALPCLGAATAATATPTIFVTAHKVVAPFTTQVVTAIAAAWANAIPCVREDVTHDLPRRYAKAETKYQGCARDAETRDAETRVVRATQA